MSGSSYKGKKQIKIVVMVILLSLWVTSISSGRAAASADWGDVVDVNYSLWTDAAHTQPVTGNIDNDIPYICIVKGSTVPPETLARFPEARAGFLEMFKEELVGIELNKEKMFVIPFTEHTYSGELSGKDLYYLVRLINLRYDASGFTSATESNTTQPNATQTIDTLFLIGVGVIILVGIVSFTTMRGNRQRKRALSEESSSASRRERSLSEKKIKLKELRELAEQHDPSVDIEEPTKSDVKFRRRR